MSEPSDSINHPRITAGGESDHATIAVSEFIAIAPDSILIVDASGAITSANQQALELFRYTERELTGQSIDTLVLPSQREAHQRQRLGYQEEPRVRQMGYQASQLIGVRSDGSKVPVDIALSPVVIDGTTCTMAVVRDCTARLNAERQHAIMRQRLAITEDRERIARDLHDLVIQRLFATGMQLQGALDNPDVLRDCASDAVGDLDETIVVLRESIFHLKAPSQSLSRQISNLLLSHEASVMCDVRITVDSDIDELPSQLGEHLVPTLNEALSNVVRHAGAASVDVSVSIDPNTSVTVTVADDGSGLAEDATPGFGLANLRRRAEQLDGTMEIRRGNEGGTTMIWSVPIDT